MKQCRKVLALVLALVMLLSAACVGLTASAINVKGLYTGSALSGKMNVADKYELTDAQYASIILDFADKTLAEANIPLMTIALTDGLKIQINATSINGLNRTIIDLNAIIDKASSFLGDIASMDFSAFSTSTARDGKTSATDVAFINALVSFLSDSDNYPKVGKLIRNGLGTGSGQLNPGSIVNNFIPSNIKDITNDIVGFLKETLFQDRNASFDANIATMVTELINGMDMEMLDGYTFEASDSIYTTIDKLTRVLTKWLVGELQADTWHFKDMILSAMPNFEEEYPFVNLDGITEISWDWEADGMGKKFVAGTASTYIIYHLNNLIGHVVDKLIPEFKNFTCTIPGLNGTKGWAKDNSTSSLSTLNDNIARAAQFADIKLNNGGTFTATEIAGFTKANATKSYAMVLADAMIRMFLPGLKVEKTDIQAGNICVLAVQALNEFMCYYIPEHALSDLYTYNESGAVLNRTKYTENYCNSLYKSMIAECLAKFSTGYFPITFSNKTNLDAVLKDLAKYFLNTVCRAGSLSEGALGTISSSETVYQAVDRIIFSLTTSGSYIEGCTNGGRNTSGILPMGFLPSKYNTTQKIVKLLFSAVENLDVGSLLEILVPNSSNTEMTTEILPNLGCYEVIRIINVLFPGTWTQKTGSLDALITNSNLATIVENILKNINMNYHIYPALRLVSTIMGLSSPQTRGEAEVSLANAVSANGATIYTNIEPIINSSTSSIPDNTYYIKVANTSKGINGGYHNASGQEIQWNPYILKVKSITCENAPNVTVSGVASSGTNVDSNSSEGFAISGAASAAKSILVFKVKYIMSYEDGRFRANQAEQETRLYVYIGSAASATLTSNTVKVTVPTTVYGTPAMFSNTVAYAATTDAAATYSGSAEDTTWPTALVNAGFKFTASDCGTPATTAGSQFKPFSVSVPSTVNLANYYGNYTISYKLKTKNTSDENASYSGNQTQNVTWVLFDDDGLASLVSKYKGMDMQQADFTNSTLWNKFTTELNKAELMLQNPSAYGTTAAALSDVFSAEVKALTQAYENLAESSTADYTADLKARLVEFADGDAANDIRAKYSMWDYTPVSYARYDSSLSAVRKLYNNKETSSIKVTEALRFNEEMSKILFTSNATETSKAAALTNLTTVRSKFNKANYDATKYTPASYEALIEAFDDADQVIDGTGLAGGDSVPKTSDYADARAAILAALNKLTVQPLDVDALYAAVTAAQEQYNDNMYYTDEAWAVFEAALNQANVAINDPYSLLPDDYTDSDIAAVNATLPGYITELNNAIATLQANPYVSTLVSSAQGAVSYKEGQKLLVGNLVIDAENYIILPYGVPANKIAEYFTFSKNTSRYTKDEEGNWNTYGTESATFQAEQYNDKTGVWSNVSPTAKVKSGNKLTVTDNSGNSKVFTIVVSENVGGIAVSTSNFSKAKDQLELVLPSVVSNNIDAILGAQILGTGTTKKAVTIADILACDLNGDGLVDNTDLVLLSMWKAGTYTPYSVV